ncbi:MAG: DUF4405 domain-containing protein [Methanosphaera stadtmanae]|nr:DUF4405 domain-containing protein [Methanosphaera stadtmanae]
MIKRIIINILLLILTLLEFSKVYLTPEIHEIIGITLIILIIIHLIQNKRYLQSINKTRTGNILFITNILLLITFTLTVLTGLLSSQLIPILNIHQITTNYLHKILAYITLILISIHLGLNLNKTFKKIEDKIRNKKLEQTIKVIIILIGIISFIQLDYLNHLTGNIGFSTNNTNIIINTLQYLSVVLAITLITHQLNKISS